MSCLVLSLKGRHTKLLGLRDLVADPMCQPSGLLGFSRSRTGGYATGRGYASLSGLRPNNSFVKR